MKKYLFLVFLIFSVTILTGTRAFAIPFTMVNYGSDNVSNLSVNVTDIAGGAQITVNITGAVIGDITGVFFDLSQNVGSGTGVITSISGTPTVTVYEIKEGEVDKIQPFPNITPYTFDVGVRVGTSAGINGGDDYQTAVIQVLGAGIDSLDFTRIGVRIQSVGVEGSREGSAKYVGTPGTPAPEPASAVLLGSSLIAIAAFRRRSKRS